MGKEKRDIKEAIVVISGGLDSTVLAYWLHKLNYKLTAISFNYGQRHSKELQCAKTTCRKLNIEHNIINISAVFKQFDSASALLNINTKIPESHYTHSSQKATVVPNRNMIMLAIAIGFAEERKIPAVYYAAHKNDTTIYPDCRERFVRRLSQASREGTYTNVRVQAPFCNKYKSDLVKLGVKLKIPFRDTWSCYTGVEVACGKCGTCRERLEAFKKNNMWDPVTYA